MEKIRSGQGFLYRENGYTSTVLDIRMTRNVRGDLLRRALDRSLERYPYLTSKLVEKDGEFYLAQNPTSMTVVRTRRLRVLGSMSTNYHLVDVTYWENHISVSFHHGLCDGRGIMPFLATLVHYYCLLRHDQTLDPTGIRLAGEPLLPGETLEPFGATPLPVDPSAVPVIDKDGYHLPECDHPSDSSHRYEFTIDRQAFLDHARSIGATPAILLSLLVSAGIRAVHPDADKPIVCSLATDMRAALGADNTHRNTVGSIHLPQTAHDATLPLPEQAHHLRDLMAVQRTPDALRALANQQIALFAKLDGIHSLEGRKEALSFYSDLLIDTYVVSYLGEVGFGSADRYVESVHLYSSGGHGLRINMVCAGGTFSVDWIQDWESDDILRAVEQLLAATQVPFGLSDRIEYSTPPEKAWRTASHQAQRYARVG